jgi:hypothetical protein
MALIAAAISQLFTFRHNSMNEKESGGYSSAKDLWKLLAILVGVIVVASLMMNAIEKLF